MVSKSENIKYTSFRDEGSYIIEESYIDKVSYSSALGPQERKYKIQATNSINTRTSDMSDEPAFFSQKANVKIDSGRSLPHWEQGNVLYFVTFRTHDSIPPEVSKYWQMQKNKWLLNLGIDPTKQSWKEELKKLPELMQRSFRKTFSEAYLASLDKGYGSCPLKDETNRKFLIEAFKFYDADRYRIDSYVIMPNHVHIIVQMKNGNSIRSQTRLWKIYSSRKINDLMNKKGRFWQSESFDHLIRSEYYLNKYRKYIHENPKNLKANEYTLFQRW